MTAAVHSARPTDTWFDAAMDVIVLRAPEAIQTRRGAASAQTARPSAFAGRRPGLSFG